MDPDIRLITFNEDDFKIEWYSGTGAGGSNRNKKQCSCRITHVPTGTISTAQCRSRINSLEEARQSLIKKLTLELNLKNDSELANNRKDKVGSGMRGDKIRTYRLQDDIVKDHNTNKSANATKVLKGNFDLLW